VLICVQPNEVNMTAIESIQCKMQSKLADFEHGAARVARGTAAGFLGGLLASWVMNQYQAIESQPVNVRRAREIEESIGLSEPTVERETSQSQANGPTVKVAEAVSRQLFDHPLSANAKKIAGPGVHYGYGAAVGALYGGLAELLPVVGIGGGVPYAAMLWLFGSEIAVPALGLAKPPAEVPAANHASNIATHFVYGVTLDITRRILRRIL